MATLWPSTSTNVMCVCVESYDSFYYAIFSITVIRNRRKNLRQFILLRDILQFRCDWKWCYSWWFGKFKLWQVVALRYQPSGTYDSAPRNQRTTACVDSGLLSSDFSLAVFKLPVSHAMAGIGTYGACFHPVSPVMAGSEMCGVSTESSDHAVFMLPVSHTTAGIGTFGACYHPVSPVTAGREMRGVSAESPDHAVDWKLRWWQRPRNTYILSLYCGYSFFCIKLKFRV